MLFFFFNANLKSRGRNPPSLVAICKGLWWTSERFPYVIPTFQHPIGAGTYLSSSLSVLKKSSFQKKDPTVQTEWISKILRLEQEEARIDNLFLPAFLLGCKQQKYSLAKLSPNHMGIIPWGETSEVAHLSDSIVKNVTRWTRYSLQKMNIIVFELLWLLGTFEKWMILFFSSRRSYFTWGFMNWFYIAPWLKLTNNYAKLQLRWATKEYPAGFCPWNTGHGILMSWFLKYSQFLSESYNTLYVLSYQGTFSFIAQVDSRSTCMVFCWGGTWKGLLLGSSPWNGIVP